MTNGLTQRYIIAISDSKKKLLLLLLLIVIVIIVVFIFPQIIEIGAVLQLKNPNHYKLLNLLNVTKMYYTLQNFITR